MCFAIVTWQPSQPYKLDPLANKTSGEGCSHNIRSKSEAGSCLAVRSLISAHVAAEMGSYFGVYP